MSELKAGVLVTPHDEGMCFHKGSDVIPVTERETEFYLKSEADKALMDKDKEIAELKNRIAPKQSDKTLQERLNEVCEKHGVSTLQDLDWAFCESEKMRSRDNIEADKVIAELKKQLKNSRNARKYWRKEYLIEYKECCHHKYKRCLAMAKWCNDRYILDDCLYELGKTRFYERWEKRWLELAEKFKHNKEAK